MVVKDDRKTFLIRVICYTLMITSLIVFSFLYDFNTVKGFVYNNF